MSYWIRKDFAMKKATRDMGLLDFLAAKAGCMYLSDLHTPVYQCMVGSIIRQTDVEYFSLSEWNDAVKYISGESKQFPDKTKAAEYLQNYAYRPVKKPEL